MPSGPLFAKHDIHDVIENRVVHMVEEYKTLPDEAALDEAVISGLKARYLLNIPVIRPAEEMWAEEGKTLFDVRRLPNRVFFDTGRPIMEEVPEYTVHIPFDGDPRVFDLAPSAYNSRVAVGEVVGYEVLLRIVLVTPDFDVQGEIDRQVSQINWALTALKEKLPYLDQQLEIAIRQAIQARKRSIELRANSTVNLRIPIRQAATAPAAKVEPQEPIQAQVFKSGAGSKQFEPPASEKWDVFISHASEDKPYVEHLVASLQAVGVTVWLDALVVRWGESLLDAINRGLRDSSFVIVLLSKAFLKKKQWTEHELSSVFALEGDGKKRILPILHGIRMDDFRQYNSGLSIRLALDSTKNSNSEIANELLILLNRRPANAISVHSSGSSQVPAWSVSGSKQGERVADTLYWTPEGKIAGLTVRKVTDKDGRFTLEQPDGTVNEGTLDEIAVKYVATRLRLRSEGLTQHGQMGSSDYPQFNP